MYLKSYSPSPELSHVFNLFTSLSIISNILLAIAIGYFMMFRLRSSELRFELVKYIVRNI